LKEYIKPTLVMIKLTSEERMAGSGDSPGDDWGCGSIGYGWGRGWGRRNKHH